MIDFKRGAKTTGSKFYFNIGESAWQEWELMDRMIRFHISSGYHFVLPPYLVKRKVGEWARQLPQFEGDYYMTKKEDFMLIPTAETALVGLHANEILKEERLPLKYVAFSPCFRREAGTYGKRDKGLRRVHQFHKIELFRIEKPEEAWKVFDEMVEHIIKTLRLVGIPRENIRQIELDEKERNLIALRTVDIEIRHPETGEWLEVSSISNTGENQSKPALIRYKEKKTGKNIKCHLINGSGVALPRLMLAMGVGEQNDTNK